MEKRLLKLVTIAVAAISLLACNNGNGGDQPDAPTLSTSAPSTLTFSAEGNAEIVLVTTNQPSWDVTLTPSNGNGWLTLVKNDDSFTLTAIENSAQNAPAPVTVIVTAGTAPQVVITAEQDPAALPAYAFGDLYPDADAPEGIVWYIDPASSLDGGETGTHGKILSLDELDNCKYVDPNTNFGTTSMDDGQGNWEAILDSGKPFGENTCLAWLAAKGEGWYLPAMNEWRRFYAAISGVDYDDYAETWLGPTGMPTPQAPFRFDAGPVAARDAFNLTITEAGGTIFLHYGLSTWTSTEYDESMQWTFQSATGGGSTSMRYNSTGLGRAMKVF